MEEHKYPDAKRRAYNEAWFAVAGKDAERLSGLTIEEVGTAKEYAARRAAREEAAAAEKDSAQRKLPEPPRPRRRRR
jgi:hypothetical protein